MADTVDGFVRAAVAPHIDGRTIQLGTGRADTIGDLVELARRLTGNDATVVTDESRMRPDASEVLALQSDPSLARELLGWTAATTLEDGVAATVDWMRDRPDPVSGATHVQL